ncbi:MAG: PA2779 family protein [Gammaproteobacteria bacterium]
MRYTQQPMAWFLSFLLALLPLMPAQAAMLGNDRIISEQQITLDRAKILEVLDQQFTRQQLETWGVSPEMARERINSLTGQELANINRQFDELEAGGGILGILLVIFIVFVITDALGATDIFPFVHPIK